MADTTQPCCTGAAMSISTLPGILRVGSCLIFLCLVRHGHPALNFDTVNYGIVVAEHYTFFATVNLYC
jgi:hypothetical protein